jgi:hypothetical protein
MTTRPAVSRALCAVLLAGALLTGCSDDPEPPRPLSAGQVDGTAVPGDGVLGTSALGCDAERETVLQGSSPDDFKTYERTVGSTTETVVVGVWKMSEEKAAAATQELEDAIATPQCSGTRFLVQPQGVSGEHMVGFQANDLESPGNAVTRSRAYSWKDGWMTAVWLERDDGSNPAREELVRLSNEQRDQITG